MRYLAPDFGRRNTGMRATKGRSGDDTGAVAIVVAVFILAAVILLAFVVDRGRVYVTRSDLQNVVDAAALAAGPTICSGGDPELTANQYAEANGVDALEADLVTPTGRVVAGPPVNGPDFTSYFTVRTAQELSLFFGPFAGVDETGVAAQATVAIPCKTKFRFVSDELTNFNGTGSLADNIYAGRCFEGSGGTYGIVAVYVSPSYNCWTGSPNPTRPPIDFGTSGGGNPGTGIAQYNKPPGGPPAVPYSRQSAELAFPLIPTLDTYTATVECRNVSDFATPTNANDSIVCGASGGSLALSAPISVTYVVADDDITDSGVVWNPSTWDADTGQYLIYSRTGDISLNGNYLPKNVTLFAPNGAVTFTGGSATIDGQVYANEITLNGSGSDAATGQYLEIVGDPYLAQ